MNGRRNRRRLWPWALALAGVAAAGAAALVWAVPDAERRELVAEAGERAGPLRAAVADASREIMDRLPWRGEGGAGPAAVDDHDDEVAAVRPAGRDDDDDDERPSRVEVINGVPTVRLDAETQSQSGIETTTLGEVTFAPEIAAVGQVVDLQPLLALRARFESARYQAAVTRALLSAAEREYERLQALHQDAGGIAAKRLQEAEADYRRRRAELAAAEAEMRSVREQTVQQWGPEIAEMALGGGDALAPLLAREEALLLVTLPAGETLPPGTEMAFIARSGERAAAREAHHVSPAAYTDPLVQGETHFFRTEAGTLRAGMRVDVWINRTAQGMAGVIVPQESVIWATGQAWAYVQIDDQHFARRSVSTRLDAPGGWFVTEAIKPGERLVTAGAQMLYAEEFRWQIRNEDED